MPPQYPQQNKSPIGGTNHHKITNQSLRATQCLIIQQNKDNGSLKRCPCQSRNGGQSQKLHPPPQVKDKHIVLKWLPKKPLLQKPPQLVTTSTGPFPCTKSSTGLKSICFWARPSTETVWIYIGTLATTHLT